MKPPRKKPSLRDTMIANEKALEFLCKMNGKELPENMKLKESNLPPAPKQRAAPTHGNIPTEHEEQKAFVKWFRIQFPNVRIFAVPNAAIRSPETAAYCKAEGLTAGVLDLWIPEWCTAIEMKRVKGSVTSDEQHGWINYLLGIGWRAYVCKGLDEARSVAMAIAKEVGK